MRTKIIVLGLILIAAGSAASAAGPSVQIAPKTIVPGSAVVITVTDAEAQPEGSLSGRRLHFHKTPKGYQAIAGVDLSAGPGAHRLEIKAGESDLSRDVIVAKKKFPVQRLTLPEDMVTLTPENEARVARDQKRMAALWPVDSEQIWSKSFIDPLPGRPVGTVFGVRRIINSIPKNSHSGVDITADEGEPVKAPNDGVVVLVDDQFFSGRSVVLDHGDGIYTMFFHLSKVHVRYGQAVMKGDVIAEVGSTGRATGAHLHWGARVQGAKVDPLQLIRLKLD